MYLVDHQRIQRIREAAFRPAAPVEPCLNIGSGRYCLPPTSSNAFDPWSLELRGPLWAAAHGEPRLDLGPGRCWAPRHATLSTPPGDRAKPSVSLNTQTLPSLSPRLSSQTASCNVVSNVCPDALPRPPSQSPASPGVRNARESASEGGPSRRGTPTPVLP